MFLRSPLSPTHGIRRPPASSLALVAICWLAFPASASAQFWKQLGFGVNAGVTESIDSEVDAPVVVGFTGGTAPEKGWGFTAGLGWFEADLVDARGMASRRVGTAKVRPVMAGVGYTWLNGRVATTASLTAGISINGATLDSALAAAPAGQTYALDIENSFAMRPALEVEYFLARKLALSATASFLFTRPDIVLITPERRVTDRWNASSFNLVGGVVVYPFR
jgi:hypothetical protein